MTRRPHPVIFILLAIWALSPLALLVLQALSRQWRYPHLLPQLSAPSALFATGARQMLPALTTSVILAVLTGLVSAGLGFTIARSMVSAGPAVRRLALAVALFSVVVPPIALGVGLQIALLTIGLSGTMIGVLLAHLVSATGYVVLFAAAVLATFPFPLLDEARTLGASPLQVIRRVTMPLLAGPLREAAVLGGLVSWGQLALTLLIGGGLVRTLPLELLLLVRSGDDQLGALAAVVLSAPPMLALGLLQVATRRTGAAL